MQKFDALIFDLGNVIVDIDFEHCAAQFQKLAVVNFSELFSYHVQSGLFDAFETGKISTPDFLEGIKKHLAPGTTNEQVIAAWESIFEAFPENKLQLLLKLKTKYRVLALSNTNEIHVRYMNRYAKEKLGLHSFSHFFHHAYYSNEMGLRKPDAAIYETVLAKEKLEPSRTLFVDDKMENVVAALHLGIRAHCLEKRDKLEDLLTQLEVI